MATKGYLSPDTDEFFTSFEALFSEAHEKGFQKRDELKNLRTSVANYLHKCSTMTAARAGNTNPVLLPDGSQPGVVLAKPPSWLKINEKQRRALIACAKTEKFIDTLRKYAVQQTPTVESAKRYKRGQQTQALSDRPRKRRKHETAAHLSANTVEVKEGAGEFALCSQCKID